VLTTETEFVAAAVSATEFVLPVRPEPEPVTVAVTVTGNTRTPTLTRTLSLPRARQRPLPGRQRTRPVNVTASAARAPPLGSAREPQSLSHSCPGTPRLHSGSTVVAPLVSGDPSASLGVTCFEGSFVAFFTCHLDQASVSERVERSPELYERRCVWSGPRGTFPFESSPPCPQHGRRRPATRGIRTLQGMSRLQRPALRAGRFRST
jgi:hypothetical protein